MRNEIVFYDATKARRLRNESKSRPGLATDVSSLRSASPKPGGSSVVFCQPKTRPLVRCVSSDGAEIVGVLRPDPTVAPYLVEHYFKGAPIFPFVLALETFAETINGGVQNALYLEYQSVKVVNGLFFSKTRPYDLKSIAVKEKDGYWKLRLVGDRFAKTGEKVSEAFPYYLGRARCSSAQGSQKIVAPFESFDAADALEWVPQYLAPNDDSLYHGPKLRGLRRCFFSKTNCEGLGEILAPSRAELLGAESSNATTDAAVLDAALVFCLYLNFFSGSGKYSVPDSIGSLIGLTGRIAPGSKCVVRARLKDRKELPGGFVQVVFDFVIFNDAGDAVWWATDFRKTEY